MTLTTSERRGALVLLAILALGAGRDLWATRPGAPLSVPPVGPADAAPLTVDAATATDTVPGARPRGRGATLPSAVLDLNHATAAEFDALPGVGPVLAGRIVAYRREHGGFRVVDELMAVRGIGPRSFARLRPWVRVAPPGTPAHPSPARAAGDPRAATGAGASPGRLPSP